MRKLVLVWIALSSACVVHDPLFCDDSHPCQDPARSYCDLTGDYDFPDHLKNSCVANPFDAMPNPDAPPAAAKLQINEDTHDFKSVQMGSESFVAQFVVTNDGQLASGTIAISVDGTNKDSFLVVPTGDASDCAGRQVGPTDSCIVQVKYHPGTAGAETAVLHVDADPGGMPTVGLMGNSLAPGALEVTAGAALDFGSVAIQSVTAPQKITIHNTGGVACTNVVIALNDSTNYKQTSTTCSTDLAANGSCDILVRFNPATVGSHPSSVSISSDQGAVSPQLQGAGTADVQVTKTGSGTVVDTLASPIINCGMTCAGTYAQTPIKLHATTSGGIPFTSWGGACATAANNPDCTLPLTQPMSMVTATFGVCVPGAGSCTNSMIKTCGANGQWSAPATCPLGCFDATRCWDVDPLNGLASALDDTKGKPTFVLTDGAQFDTDTGTVLNGNNALVAMDSVVLDQPTGYPKIRVFKVKSIKMGKTNVVGVNAIAIVSDQDIEIDGEFALTRDSTRNVSPGQMGCNNQAGHGGYPNSTTRLAGGGGGGFAGAGGRGGNNPPTSGGVAGAAQAWSLSPLRGGCEGGNAMASNSGFASGGGAVQLVSRTAINILGNGSINAGGLGAPGRVSVPILGFVPGGHGGGAGGGILLEAPSIQVSGATAALAANGGGGSADCDGGKGEDGHASASPAMGGKCPGDSTRSDGGKGWVTGAFAPDNGADFVSGSDLFHAGGGGGGQGAIRVDSLSNTSGFIVSGGGLVSGDLARNAVGRR